MLKKLFTGFLIISLFMCVVVLFNFIINGEYDMIVPLIATSMFYVVPLVLMWKPKSREQNTSKKTQYTIAMPDPPIKNNKTNNNFDYEEETRKQMELSDMYYQFHLKQLQNLNFNNITVDYNSNITLPALEISFLKYISGMDVNNLNIAGYWTHEYGIQYQQLITKFIANDFLLISSFKPLESFKVDELKDMLRNSNLQVSGKKTELINRLKSELTQQQYQLFTNSGSWHFVLTAKGEYFASLSKKSLTKDLDFEDYCINLIMQCKFEEAYETVQYFHQNKPISYMQGKDYSTNKLNNQTIESMFGYWNKEINLPTYDKSVAFKLKSSVILAYMLGNPKGVYDLFVRLTDITERQDEYFEIISNCDIDNFSSNKPLFEQDTNDKKPLKPYQIVSGKMKHVVGLPIPNDISCEITSLPESYNFKVNNSKFNLDKCKVVDICIKKDVEIQKQYVSSIGGAIGGALVFGPLGAIVGGRAKQKVNKTSISYLIFSYFKNDNLEYISFEIPKRSWLATTLITEFKNYSNTNKPVSKFDL